MHESTYQCNQRDVVCMAISSRGAERMSSMQSLSAYMLIGLHFPIWIWTLLKWTCLPVHFKGAQSAFFLSLFCTCTQTALLLTWHAFLRCSWVRSEINGCTPGHVKMWIPDIFFFSFCCLMMCSRDTANIARQPSSHRRAERTISAQMQISDSEAYAEEVTPVTIHKGLSRSL